MLLLLLLWLQVYVSQPKGVGYSYCDEQPCINTDETRAQDAYDFFVAFFEAFPQYKANDFYLTAESYGPYNTLP